jgi:hypothetical protein
MKRLFFLVLLLAAAATAGAAEVRQHLWGFDGTVTPERMNLLSVLVENATPKPFDGAVTLYQEHGIGSRLGEMFTEPCYLSPYARRWVQFLVYVPDNSEAWELDLDPATSPPARLTAPKAEPPACVLLADPESFQGTGSGIKRFPENLFPISVCCTDGLHAVVMDHEPRWEPAKREAFMDWVRRGGTVHLAKGADGTLPLFAGDLAELNVTGGPRRVGAGLVARHDLPSGEITVNYLASRGYPALKMQHAEGYMAQSFTRRCFEKLRQDVRPKHNWPVIYGMTVLYILLIGPVGLLVGRRMRDFRIATGYTLAVIAAFSALFLVIGRRGYGESARITTLAYARPVGAGAWDVTQWSNLFVTAGNWYTVTHPSPHNYYATCQEFESVNGAAQGGREGGLRVDIPLFSSREFLHRGRFEGPKPPQDAVIRRSLSQLESLRLTGNLPAGMKQAVAFYSGKFYPARVEPNAISVSSEKGLARDAYFQNMLETMTRHYYSEEETLDLDAMFKHLIARVVGNSSVTPSSVMMPDSGDQVHLFILADQPEAFRANLADLGPERGWVCYHLTFNVEGSDVN